MVFSAPEITTVSKPKRNPASADVSDQKKMRPFIREYRVKTSDFRLQTSDLKLRTSDLRARRCLRSDVRRPVSASPRSCLQRKPFLAPIANSAVHRNHILVAHLLQIVRSQRRAEASAAVKH